MTKKTWIYNARLLSSGKELDATTMLIEAGKIHAVGVDAPAEAHESINLHGQFLSPGFIDIQLNGGYKHYFSSTPSKETLKEMTEASLEHATPYYYATLISSPTETIFSAIEAVRETMQYDRHLLGLHLEGPFLNSERKGAHKADHLQKPTDSIIERIIETGIDVVKMITIAPEICTQEQINALVNSGIQVSIGHSSASYQEAQAAFEQGINIVTHLYNAMPPMTHRSPGLIGAALDTSHVYTPIILDGRHCHPAMARLAYATKGDRLILLTDAAVLGRRLKRIDWDGLGAGLTPDGFYINSEGNLAGSAISMPEAVRNAQQYLGISLAEAADMGSGRVATAIGRSGDLGYLSPGYTAAFSIFNEDLSNFYTLAL